MFNRNEETLKKLQDRLSFQQLHFNLFLDVLARRASEFKSRIISKSKLLADKMDMLNAVNPSIEKKCLTKTGKFELKNSNFRSNN